jgi:hypothetical protein
MKFLKGGLQMIQQVKLYQLKTERGLEQESILDKIRAEIENLEEGISSYHNDRPWIYKDEVLQIIDKYKAEMERGK